MVTMQITHKELRHVSLLLLAICPLVVTAQNDILCSASVCKDPLPPYTEDNTTICDHIPATRWPAPEICNCGTQCVKNLQLNDDCKITQNNFPLIVDVCGPGLICTKQDGKKRTCQPYSNKVCVQELEKYIEDQASGVLGPGRYMPVCDDLGDYYQRQCSTASTCYCVDKDGNKVFGEGAMTGMSGINCLCAKFWDDSAKIGREGGFRCLTNGNFDKLQCINKQYCFCFDPIKGDITEGPWGFNMLTMLSCYDKNIHGVNYSQPCTEALEEYENNVDDDDDLIIIGESNKPQCGPDGYYSAVQYEGNMAYCADTSGYQIEDFRIPLDQAWDMKCSCARRRFMMEQGGLGSSKPKCHQNGDFCVVQKRGLLAYCVDGNGNQDGKTEAIDNIPALNCAQLPGTMQCD